jgi:hypothetical protein
MAGPPLDHHHDHESDSVESAPRWVKVFGIVGLVLVVVFVIVYLAGGGLGHHGM